MKMIIDIPESLKTYADDTTDGKLGCNPITEAANGSAALLAIHCGEIMESGEWINYQEEGYVECPFCHSLTNCNGNIKELHFCFSCGAELGTKDTRKESE